MFSDFYKDFLSAAKDLPEDFKTEEKAEKYYTHLCALFEAEKSFNLTAITDLSSAVRLHVIDSLFAAETLEELSCAGKASLIDVGSGGGFPSIPVAVACGNISVTALDATAKKCEFIAGASEKCGVFVETVAERAEEAVKSRRETYDFAAARAVARLNVLSELCAPYIKVGGYLLAMKGSAAEEERSEAANATEKLGLTYERSVDYEIDGGGQRRILVYKKTSPTPKEFPRRYAQIKKKPLV